MYRSLTKDGCIALLVKDTFLIHWRTVRTPKTHIYAIIWYFLLWLRSILKNARGKI
jgi:hypothetical protein